MQLTRRTALTATSATAAAAVVEVSSPARGSALPGAGADIRLDPFTLGVASGDPAPDSVVLWTRLAINPLDDSGTGGMPGRDVTVAYEVASDAGMRRVVRRGTGTARADAAHSVHVEVQGLRPGREYWYRFRLGRHLTAVARTRTAPAGHEMPSELAMSFASCAHYEEGWFSAYRHVALGNPDLVLHLGDYQYEYKYNPASTGRVREHAGPETSDLASYRLRHAQYKTDPDLQAAHAVAPWLVVFDDHEVDNNWAGDVPENTEPAQGNANTTTFRARRAAAFQAYWENMPLRRSSLPHASAIQIYRRLHWGRLATFHMMDTRQYRDDQACGDGWQQDCAAREDPARSITGSRQERWLLDGFAASRARWDLLGQQVFFAARDGDPTTGNNSSMDGWDGYTASRQRITDGWVRAGVRNPVVLTGDVHKHWASDILANHDDPNSAVVASELVSTSVTSGGDGTPGATDPLLEHNQHLKYMGNQRGFVSTTIRPGSLTADFEVLDAVTRPDAALRTDASFVLHDRQRGLQRV
ncbi:alkaline phosphatase D family protein [Dermacoccaceae bacterium W4C1]